MKTIFALLVCLIVILSWTGCAEKQYPYQRIKHSDAIEVFNRETGDVKIYDFKNKRIVEINNVNSDVLFTKLTPINVESEMEALDYLNNHSADAQ